MTESLQRVVLLRLVDQKFIFTSPNSGPIGGCPVDGVQMIKLLMSSLLFKVCMRIGITEPLKQFQEFSLPLMVIVWPHGPVLNIWLFGFKHGQYLCFIVFLQNCLEVNKILVSNFGGQIKGF